MQIIKIPDNVQIVDAKGNPIGKPKVWLEWFRDTVLLDPKLGKTSKQIMMVVDIRTTIDRLPDVGAKYLELTDDQYDTVKPVIEEPSGGYNPSVAVQIVSFMKAYLNPISEKDYKELLEGKEEAAALPPAEEPAEAPQKAAAN